MTVSTKTASPLVEADHTEAMQWFRGPQRDLACRACGSTAPKPPRVTFFSLVYGHDVTCYECPDCTALFLDTLPPPSYLGETSQAAHDHYVLQGAAIDVMILPLFRLERSNIRRYMEIGC